MLQTQYYEDYQIGASRETGGRTITETDIVLHAGQTGDSFYPHHMDAELCNTQDFKQRIAQARQTGRHRHREGRVHGKQGAHCDDLIATPINLGSSELVSINTLVSKVEKIAGVKLKRSYNLDAPQGVAGRNSDNTFIKKVLKWEPNKTLDKGLAVTYKWIKGQYQARKAGKRVGIGWAWLKFAPDFGPMDHSDIASGARGGQMNSLRQFIVVD
jgi:hypothetical protein